MIGYRDRPGRGVQCRAGMSENWAVLLVPGVSGLVWLSLSIIHSIYLFKNVQGHLILVT